MNHFELEIDGSTQFARSYSVYVIRIAHASDKPYYYVGQTSDRKYKTAKSAFRRFARHLDDAGNATDNEVYRFIATDILGLEIDDSGKFTKKLKVRVSDFLIESKIKQIVFPIMALKEDVTESEHKKNREFVESIENEVILRMIDAHTKEHVLNSKASDKKRLTAEADKIVEEIVKVVE